LWQFGLINLYVFLLKCLWSNSSRPMNKFARLLLSKLRTRSESIGLVPLTLMVPWFKALSEVQAHLRYQRMKSHSLRITW
jgi:hypothetical protein